MNPFLVYTIIGTLEVLAEATAYAPLRYLTKPLLMPVLLWAYASAVSNRKDRIFQLMAASLIFSFSGDVNLMFEKNNPVFFLLGLGSFLITHLLYIDVFRRSMHGDPLSGLKQKLPFMAITIIYCAGLMSYLFPLLGELKVPVLIYGLAIFSMGFMGILRLNPIQHRPALITLLGAVLFVLSDSCIALNKFAFGGQMPWAAVSIMTLYISAQYFIVKGILLHQQSVSD